MHLSAHQQEAQKLANMPAPDRVQIQTSSPDVWKTVDRAPERRTRMRVVRRGEVSITRTLTCEHNASRI